jgi:hypothetical protein
MKLNIDKIQLWTDLNGPVHADNLWMLQLGEQEDLLTDQLFNLQK